MEQATTSARVVSVSKEPGGVALIHLNRPPANSYDRAFLDDLNAAVDDVKRLLGPTFRHRLLVRPEAEVAGRTADAVLDSIIAQVTPPR